MVGLNESTWFKIRLACLPATVMGRDWTRREHCWRELQPQRNQLPHDVNFQIIPIQAWCSLLAVVCESGSMGWVGCFGVVIFIYLYTIFSILSYLFSVFWSTHLYTCIGMVLYLDISNDSLYYTSVPVYFPAK